MVGSLGQTDQIGQARRHRVTVLRLRRDEICGARQNTAFAASTLLYLIDA